jgi:hypothetical protein
MVSVAIVICPPVWGWWPEVAHGTLRPVACMCSPLIAVGTDICAACHWRTDVDAYPPRPCSAGHDLLR